MSFRLIEKGWQNEIDAALSSCGKDTSIICPFIKYRVAEHILKRADATSMRVITRFSLEDFANGVSDISALELLCEAGAQIRGIKNVHAKLYVFGRNSIILTSANLTLAGLHTNYEFGCFADETEIVETCSDYFSQRWSQAKPATVTDFASWQQLVTKHNSGAFGVSTKPQLPDYGAEQTKGAALPTALELPIRVSSAERAFVKFFGTSSDRADRSMTVLDEVTSTNSNAVLSYPAGKRPRQIQDGDIVFVGRLVRDPDDLMIYGRAIGMKHDESRDDATPVDIERRGWRANWPHYIRIHHPELMGGTLANGISLSDLMDEFDYISFASTYRNHEAARGNVNPRHAYQQQAQVELTQKSTAWLNSKLNQAFARYGTLSPADLESII